MLRLEWIPTSVRLERRTTNMVDPHSQLDCAALKSQSQRAHEFTYGTEQVDTGGRANGRRHCAREAAATLHSSAKGRDEHARTLGPPPPCIVEQVQACSISRSLICM